MRKRADWKVLLTCMGVAVMFWLLNALGMDYNNTVVEYPIKIEFPAKKNKKKIPPNLPKTIKIQVSNNGWDLLKFNMRKVKPIIIKVRRLRTITITRTELRKACKAQIEYLKFNKVLTRNIRLYK